MRGLSLAEAIVALFLLTAGVLVAVTAFQRSLTYQRDSTRLRQAGQLAQNYLVQLARYRDNFPGTNWPAYWSGYAPDRFREEPFAVEVRCRVPEVFSPCLTLEQPYGGRGRRLPDSAVEVDILLDWGGPQRQFRYVSLLAPPTPLLQSVRLTRVGSGSLSPNNHAVFQAEALDGSGYTIPGACFSWSVDTDGSTHQPGMGTLNPTADRSGREMWVFHRIYRPDEVVAYAPGRVRVKAVCRLNGVERSALVPLELLP
jgi:hypothetical protein